jgi:hypothetical protein
LRCFWAFSCPWAAANHEKQRFSRDLCALALGSRDALVAVFVLALTARHENRLRRRLLRLLSHGRILMLFGSGFLILVVLTHIAEAFHIFPAMGWGLPNSAGHYLDLVSAILRCTFPPTRNPCDCPHSAQKFKVKHIPMKTLEVFEALIVFLIGSSSLFVLVTLLVFGAVVLLR